jgi:acetyl esterase
VNQNNALRKYYFVTLVTFLFLSIQCLGQDTIPTVVTYKKIDTLSLNLWIYKPSGSVKENIRPAIVFFFGGGWIGGNIRQFKKQAQYLASRGMVAVIADYRVASRHHTTPFDAVADAKSAIRFLRANSSRFHIDPNRIVAAGGSAGGHLAAAADLTRLDEPSEEPSISSRPNALVLFNPVFNNGPGQYGHDRIRDRYPEISPYHNIKAGAAPTIVFLGTKDALISVETARSYQAKMEETGNQMELHLYEDQVHGFFNSGTYYEQTLRQTDIFLSKLGYIQGPPTF